MLNINIFAILYVFFNVDLRLLDKIIKKCYYSNIIERKYMNNSIDVLHELEVKNKEIYLNKLELDIDNNNEILIITIDNIINLFASEVTKKLLDINNSSQEIIQKESLSFHELVTTIIKQLLENRRLNLKKNVNNLENIDYKNEILSEKENIIKEIEIFYNTQIIELLNKINGYYEGFDQERINDYLTVINYNKFINKLNDAISNMDIILYNNYQDSLKRFIELNERTLTKKD